MRPNLFTIPPSDWTDDEIRVGLAQLGRDIQWHTDQHDTTRALFFTGVAVILADERDRRRRLYADAENATNPFTASEARIMSE